MCMVVVVVIRQRCMGFEKQFTVETEPISVLVGGCYCSWSIGLYTGELSGEGLWLE